MKRKQVTRQLLALGLSLAMTLGSSTWVLADDMPTEEIQVDVTSEESLFSDPAEVPEEEPIVQDYDPMPNEESEAASAASLYDEAKSSAPFYVEDKNGQIIHSYQKHDAEYLFLPKSVDLFHVTVYCQDAPSAADRGEINSEQHTLTVDASASSSVTVHISKADGTEQSLILMHSDIPSVQIRLNGTDLSTIHKNGKDKKYSKNTVTITDPEGNVCLQETDSVELKGRGNSSWYSYGDKKGYQIKFNKKKSVLGMAEAKKWVLLSNTADPTLLKNVTAFHASEQLGMKFTTDMQAVDLWIDGSYRGSYLIGEKVEIGKERLKLDQNGVLVELDNDFYLLETSFEDLYECHYVLKDPDPEEAGDSFIAFQNKLLSMEEALDKDDWDTVKSLIDVESFAKWYLLTEYYANYESCSTSCFFYQNSPDDVIHAGPVWDYDTCMEAFAGADVVNSDYYASNQAIYGRLLRFSGFSKAVSDAYQQYRSVFAESASYMKNMSKTLMSSADMNYALWDVLGKADIKGHVFNDTYQTCVSDSVNWLKKRAASFKTPIPVSFVGKIPTSSYKENCVDIFRLYNPNSGEHFYTWNTAEAMHLRSLGWNYEGIGWTAPVSSKTPVYRLYNPNAGDHHYTSSPAERNACIHFGWKYEGICWYSDDAKGSALYRQYNPNARSGTHNYTVSKAENDFLVRVGWRAEGISWYGVKCTF